MKEGLSHLGNVLHGFGGKNIMLPFSWVSYMWTLFEFALLHYKAALADIWELTVKT